MAQPTLHWICGHCLGLNSVVCDIHCSNCSRRRDAYAVVPLGDEVCMSLSHQQDPPEFRPKVPAPKPSKSTPDAIHPPIPIDVDKPYDTGIFQTYSTAPGSQFEDYLFSSNNPGGQDWLPSEKIRFSEAKGLLTFSLATGEPATAPRRRAYSPARRAEVALVRKHRACSSCRLRKQAVSYSISLLALYMLIVHL